MAVLALLVQEWARPIFRHRRESGVVVVAFSPEVWETGREAVLAALAQAAKHGSLEAVSAQRDRVTVTWRFRGMPSAQIPVLERRLAESGRPESLSVVYTADAAGS